MGRAVIKFIFFANYFLGILAVALSLETTFQLQLPFNSVAYYLFLVCSTILYYTYAYTRATSPTGNPRTEWYWEHRRFVSISQVTLLFVCAGLGLWILTRHIDSLFRLPYYYWLAVALMGAAALLYYGNLRNTGWAKAFVIGFVWACTVNVLPLVALHLENTPYHADPILVLWLFTKNWMFCTVNAIMFDLKDYTDDANRHLQTFAVRFGLNKTISFIIIPLLLVGIVALVAFTSIRHYPVIPVLFNLFPFLCLLIVAYSLYTRKAILFYLIVIDGLLLVKALCGIVGTLFMPPFR